LGKRIKKAITLCVTIIIIIIVIVATFYILKNNEKETHINNIAEIFTNNNIQNVVTLKDTEEIIKDDLILKIDGENVLGVLNIDKINFKGLVYEGTSIATLDKGVGHFENSPYFDGNVCLAGHNSKEIWANLNKLQNGDSIIYTSFMGIKKYEVNNIVEISEKDWSLLSNTDENMITLITCIKNQPFKRLCVQAKEVF